MLKWMLVQADIEEYFKEIGFDNLKVGKSYQIAHKDSSKKSLITVLAKDHDSIWYTIE